MQNNNFFLFSLRFRRPLEEGRLQIALNDEIRTAIARCLLKRYDLQVWEEPDEDDAWGHMTHTSATASVRAQLLREYKSEKLWPDAMPSSEQIDDVTEQYLLECPAERFFDVIQCWWNQPWDDDWDDPSRKLQDDVNKLLDEHRAGWVFINGHFYQLDDRFMDECVLNPVHALLEEEALDGPNEEFVKAREHLQAGAYKEAIKFACDAYESALKTVVGQDHGTASELVKKLPAGFYDEVPSTLPGQMNAKVWDSLPCLRNKLGGHGQGAKVVNPPREFAELAVHLSGAFIHFLIKRKTALQPRPPAPPETVGSEDDLPF
jgi:hypothetical protein